MVNLKFTWPSLNRERYPSIAFSDSDTSARCGALTHDPEIKSLMLHHLPGTSNSVLRLWKVIAYNMYCSPATGILLSATSHTEPKSSVTLASFPQPTFHHFQYEIRPGKAGRSGHV